MHPCKQQWRQTNMKKMRGNVQKSKKKKKIKSAVNLQTIGFRRSKQ